MESVIKWLALKSIPGIGNHIFKRLIDHFKNPENVFEASEDELAQVKGMSKLLVSKLKNYKTPSSLYEDLKVAKQKGFSILTMASPDYPPLLLQIPDPPPVLYVYGELSHENYNVSVVGSRMATHYGLSETVKLCSELALAGFTVISGMARGIDTAAHEGALLGRGQTIAVLGCGLSIIYPSENRELYHRIAKNGAVISEIPVLSPPDAFHFPMRNRIISGMSLGTVVVEAGQKSGSLITARLAAEQNRQVFAVPGNIRSPQSVGTNNLIKNGAKLIENAQDIIDDLLPMMDSSSFSWQLKKSRKAQKSLFQKELPPLSSEENKVWDALSHEPVHIDILLRSLSMDAAKLLGILLQLELKGLAHQAPGKIFSKGDN